LARSKPPHPNHRLYSSELVSFALPFDFVEPETRPGEVQVQVFRGVAGVEPIDDVATYGESVELDHGDVNSALIYGFGGSFSTLFPGPVIVRQHHYGPGTSG
jgi:hypothetical protein